MNKILAFTLISIIALLAGCSSLRGLPVPGAPQEPSANMVNPASAFCEENGGKVDLRTDASGGQFGVCVFPDGSECDEWAYFRGECSPGDHEVVSAPVTPPAYINDRYGFQFGTSGDWAVEAGERLLRFRRQNYLLNIAFGRNTEEPAAVRGAPPPGQWQEAPPVSLLGQELPKRLLVSADRVKLVEYAPGLRVGELEMTIWLEIDPSQPIEMESVDLPEDVLAQADQILASFGLTDGSVPGITYEAW